MVRNGRPDPTPAQNEEPGPVSATPGADAPDSAVPAMQGTIRASLGAQFFGAQACSSRVRLIRTTFAVRGSRWRHIMQAVLAQRPNEAAGPSRIAASDATSAQPSEETCDGRAYIADIGRRH